MVQILSEDRFAVLEVFSREEDVGVPEDIDDVGWLQVHTRVGATLHLVSGRFEERPVGLFNLAGRGDRPVVSAGGIRGSQLGDDAFQIKLIDSIEAQGKFS